MKTPTLSYPFSCGLLACLMLAIGLPAGCETDAGKRGESVSRNPQIGEESTEADRATADTPFAVGSTTLFIHAETRPFDRVAGLDTGIRTLITELWYPVEHQAIGEGATRATYGDYVFGDRDMHRRMMTKTTFFHLTAETVREGVRQDQIDAAIEALFQRKRGSYPHAPVADPGPWPVVVMSHGDAGSRYNMQTLCEHLAAHGYIVIAPEHTGNSPFSMTGADPGLAAEGGDPRLRQKMSAVMARLDDHGAYGAEQRFGQSYTPRFNGFSTADLVDMDRALLERVNDLRAALHTLKTMNREGQFAGRIDMRRVGLMGRSFGGASALAGLALEQRFTAGFVVAPPSIPDLRHILPPQALVHAPRESAMRAAQGHWALASLHKPTFILAGREDALILKLATQTAERVGAAAPTRDNPYPALQSAFEAASVPAVYAVVENANHASFGVAGPYWWPELKPDTFAQFFDPQRNYRLLPAGVAHQLQKEMALAFFDLTIKANPQGLALLEANPWAKDGADMQIKGFR